METNSKYRSLKIILFAPVLMFAFSCSDGDVFVIDEIEPSISILYPKTGFNVSGNSSINIEIINRAKIDSTQFDIVGIVTETFSGKKESVIFNFGDENIFTEDGLYKLIVTWWGVDGIFADTSSFQVEILNILRLTSIAGSVELFNTLPSFAPDSKSIILQSQRTGNMDIFLINIAAELDSDVEGKGSFGDDPVENIFNITKNPNSDIMPYYWSSLNSVIYSVNNSGRYQLNLVDLTSGTITELAQDTTADLFFPSGSSDGNTIVFERSEQGIPDVWTIDMATLNSEPLLTGDASDGHPSISPVDNKLVFHSNRAGSFDIWTIPLNGVGEPSILVNWDSNERNPVWSPDGNFIVFTSDRAGNDDLWLYRISDRSSVQMTSHSSDEDFASWHPTKNELLFSSFRNGNHDVYKLEDVDKFY